MKLFGIAGWSGSGKTTLVVRLIPHLVARGLRVATLKHTHHDPLVGDDETCALAAAGAVETVVAAPSRLALIHHLAGAPEPALDDLAARFTPCDLLLVEGFKFGRHPKLEVWSPDSGKALLAAGDPSVVALACDGPPPVAGRPVFRRDDAVGIAAFILEYCHLTQ